MKYKVKVSLVATQEFEYEIEANTERKAEDAAFDKAMDNFNISSADLTDTSYDVDKQTHECDECGVEYEIPTSDRAEAPNAWAEDYHFCAKCGAAMEAEEAAKDAAILRQIGVTQ